MSSRSGLRILLIGRGGRESCIAWKLSQSALVEKVFVAPGNGGTAAGIEKVSNIKGASEDDYPRLVEIAKELKVNLVVPGPDACIVDGIEGHFRAVNIPCFAPTKEAAQVEGSKSFAKDFMARHGIPTAKYRNFTDFGSAKAYLESISHRVVIKASGLAAGKGVILPETPEEALEALKDIMLNRKFGVAGAEVVIEEYLEGEELSILTFSDGTTFRSMPPAQDHKRIFDGDQGPNTGGMGCYAPTKIASKSGLQEIDEHILKPTFDGLRSEGIPFVGLLFTGIMLTKSGPKVLEYNARFGDPETQTLLPLISNKTDFAEVLLACVDGRLHQIDIAMDDKSCAVVVIASGGYPGSYPQGKEIKIESSEDLPGFLNIFHAGTRLKENGTLVTSGGRVMAVSATADSLDEAVKRAYTGVSMVSFDGMFYRRDIAHRLVLQKSTRVD
ncbi:MAG: hypothetical protein M1829_003894 [Trizodia sp. TS-e1964]|nr:MAG: hypothetical protein M1829_003894 [Trizodia sp. TS-e1964]